MTVPELESCRVAVVVGISEYPKPSNTLARAAGDAAELAAMLSKKSYHVLLLAAPGGENEKTNVDRALDDIYRAPVEDLPSQNNTAIGKDTVYVQPPTESAIIKALSTFPAAACGGRSPDELLFYFAGHGFLTEEELRLVIPEGDKVKDVGVISIAEEVRKYYPDMNFTAIFDTCETPGRGLSWPTSAPRDLNVFLPEPRSREVYLSATSPYQTASDTSGYIQAFMKASYAPDADINCDERISALEAHLYAGQKLSHSGVPQGVSWRPGTKADDVGVMGLGNKECKIMGYLKIFDTDYNVNIVGQNEPIQGIEAVPIGNHVVEFKPKSGSSFTAHVLVKSGDVVSLDAILDNQTKPSRGRLQLSLAMENISLPFGPFALVGFDGSDLLMGAQLRLMLPDKPKNGRISLGFSVEQALGATTEGSTIGFLGPELGWWVWPGWKRSSWRWDQLEFLMGFVGSVEIPYGYDGQTKGCCFDPNTWRMGLGPSLQFSKGSVSIGVDFQPLNVIFNSADTTVGWGFPIRVSFGARL